MKEYKNDAVVGSKGSSEVSKEGNHCLTSSDFELKFEKWLAKKTWWPMAFKHTIGLCYSAEGLGHQSKVKREP